MGGLGQRQAIRSLLGPLVILLLLLLFLCNGTHAYEAVSDSTLRHIPSGAGDFDIHAGPLLAPLLKPRVPGTPGSLAAQRHFVNFFATHLPDWRLATHNSTSRTPVTGDKEVPFTNLIFTRDPPWAAVGDVGRLALVAHYDSMHKPEGFVGATDSAAPCAILLHAARSIDAALTRKWDAMKESGEAGMDEEKGVQIILLDGEEAWATWSATDSLYGARALAEAWEAQVHPALSTYRSPINAISLFMLLDLLGAPDPNVPSYFPTTHWAYQGLAKLETRLRGLGLLASRPTKHAFLPETDKGPHQFHSGYIEDDHIPFMMRGVEILHVVPMPFPSVWHTMDDDAEHLDPAAVDDWAKIVTAFAAEWMELEGYMDAPKQPLMKGVADADLRERIEL